MSLRQPLPYLLILAAVYLPTLTSSQARRSPMWFEGARLIIGDRTPAIESSAFLVEGDSFAWVGKKGDRQPPANAIRVDLTGKTVMPALVDAHVHLGYRNSATFVAENYTSANLLDELDPFPTMASPPPFRNRHSVEAGRSNFHEYSSTSGWCRPSR